MNSFSHKKLWKAALLISCFFFSACENDPKKIFNTGTKPQLIDEATNVESLLSQNGNPRAFLKAPFMLRYNVDTAFTEFPRTLQVDFFDTSGKVESRLNAMYGKYFETRSKVYLRDSVVVFNVKGDTLKTSELWWDQNTRKFYTDKFVRLKSNDKTISASKGLEASQDLSRYVFFNPTGTLLVPDSMAAQ